MLKAISVKLIKITLLVLFLLSINIPITVFASNNKIPMIGEKAPPIDLYGFKADTQEKKLYNLKQFNKNWKVVYFYPEDFTMGCTLEAKGFERLNNRFRKLNTKIIGISADKIDTHQSFCGKENLSLILLSDVNGNASKSYGSWNNSSSFRNTFLINPEGVIKAEWIGVKPNNHAMDVLNTLVKLQK